MIKKAILLFFEILFLLLTGFCIFENKLVNYAISQGAGQVSLVWNAKPIDEILAEPTFPDSLKQKLNHYQIITDGH